MFTRAKEEIEKKSRNMVFKENDKTIEEQVRDNIEHFKNQYLDIR